MGNRIKKFNEKFNEKLNESNDELNVDNIKPDKAGQDLVKNIVTDEETLESYLDAGLDPEFNHNLILRLCIRGTYRPSNKPGESYYKSFLVLMKYMKRKSNLLDILYQQGKGMYSKMCSEYGRIEILEYFDGLGLYEKYTTKDWDELVGSKDGSKAGWVMIARMQDNEIKQKTLEYLENLRDKYGK